MTFDICLRFLQSIDLIKYIFTVDFLVDLIISPPVLLVFVSLDHANRVNPGHLQIGHFLLYVGWIRWIRTFGISS